MGMHAARTTGGSGKTTGRGERSAPRPLPAFLRTFLTFLALALVLGYGWKVTQINVHDLVVNVPRIRPLVRDLLSPDVLERKTEAQTVRAPIYLPCTTEQPQATAAAPGQAYLIVEKPCVGPGESVRVEGFNFRPSTAGFVRWIPANGAPHTLDRIRTDSTGHFVITITAPDVDPATDPHHIEAEVQWGVGLPYPSEALVITVQRMVETVFLALMATFFATIVAIPLSFLAARNVMPRNPVGTFIYYVMRTLFNGLRSIEPLILAIVFAVWVGIGPFAGVLALAVHSIAAVGKLYSEAIEDIDPGPIEAITATGANPLQVIVYGMIPQVIPPFISFTIYRWDMNVRSSTIIGMVGGGGIGFILTQWINLFRYRQAGTAVWAIAIVVAIMDYVSAKVRERVL